MKVVIDTDADKQLRFHIVNDREEWLKLTRSLDWGGERPASFYGPMKYPALVMLGTTPIGDIRFSKHEVNVEFCYNFTVIKDEQRIAA